MGGVRDYRMTEVACALAPASPLLRDVVTGRLSMHGRRQHARLGVVCVKALAVRRAAEDSVEPRQRVLTVSLE